MPDFKMWIQALKIIPRISKEQWDTLDIVSRWLIATRSAVFVMTATSCAVGGLLAARSGLFSWSAFLVCLIGLVFAHAANNLLNDFTDHKRGIDKDNYFRSQYGPQPLEHGLLTQRQMFAYIAFSSAVAIVAGLYLIFAVGAGVLYLMLAGAFFALFYTWPLKYMGLGEPSVVLVWGPLMVGGTYFVVTGGHWSNGAVLVSLVYAMGPTTVLFGKHTDKLEADRQKGVKTLPVILGEKISRHTTIGLWIFQYLLLAGLVAGQILGWAFALVLLAVPKCVWAIKIYLHPRPTEPPAELPPNVWPLFLSAVAFVYNRLFGIIFLAALLLDVILKTQGVY
jgi:1,4-dihydroxy-2-naphthoate octaprenyltransferase